MIVLGTYGMTTTVTLTNAPTAIDTRLKLRSPEVCVVGGMFDETKVTSAGSRSARMTAESVLARTKVVRRGRIGQGVADNGRTRDDVLGRG